MSDVLERLRDMADRNGRTAYQIGDYWNAIDEAADEIERLREQVNTLRLELRRCQYYGALED